MLDAAEKMIKVAHRPLCIQPNAGVPVNVERPQHLPDHAEVHGQVRQAHDPVRRAHRGRLLRHHPRAHQGDPQRDQGACPRAPAGERAASRRPRRSARRSPWRRRARWAAKLARGEFVTCVELVPPKGIDMEKIIDSARALKGKGIDAVNVPGQPPGAGQDGRGLRLRRCSSRAPGSRRSPTSPARTRTSWPSRQRSSARTRWASATFSWSRGTRPASAPTRTPRRCSTWTPSACATW